MNESKNQHYIPVSYLRGFCLDYPRNLSYKRTRLSTWIYDFKSKAQPQRKGVDNILSIKYLYSVRDINSNFNNTIEKTFGKLEGGIRKAAKDLLDLFYNTRTGNIPIPQRIKEILSVFVHIQLVRTPKYKENEIVERVKKKIPNLSPKDMANLSNWLMVKTGTDLKETCESKYSSFAELFCNKNYAFFCILGDSKKFISSDAPVYMLVNDGLECEDTEICLPVNEKIFMVMKGTGNRVDVKYLNPQKDVAIIRQINEKTAANAFRYIYGSDEALVKSIGIGKTI